MDTERERERERERGSHFIVQAVKLLQRYCCR
ncbi:unnamed protein product [Spirodela intermedia]|uniref:Uncharacterized protein n=1 Tax=Spirodela intermedia TaxID=51605 RepID=A0A7I8ILF2_SPIIN|nr:unnamed protein product [Spirodela intermedia]CAA6658774.1 unnamed protein product [Spirodela intermedia]